MATQSTPNPTNTITNASDTGVGVCGGNSATRAVTITAEAEHTCQSNLQEPTCHLLTVG